MLRDSLSDTEVFELVRSGQWTIELFKQWVDYQADRYYVRSMDVNMNTDYDSLGE